MRPDVKRNTGALQLWDCNSCTNKWNKDSNPNQGENKSYHLPLSRGCSCSRHLQRAAQQKK